MFTVNGKLSRLSFEQNMYEKYFPRDHNQVILTKSWRKTPPTCYLVVIVCGNKLVEVGLH